MILLNEFVIKGNPATATAQQKQYKSINGHTIVYEKENVKKAKEDLYWRIYTHAPDEPYKANLCVRLMWLFDKQSLTKKENMTFNPKRPDLDNLAKGTLDVFQKAGYFQDDSQIVRLELSKAWYREFAGLFVQIWEVGDTVDFETFVLDWRNRVS